MASLAQQLRNVLISQRPAQDLIEFRCGKMKVGTNGTTVTPDARKGRIVVKTHDADGCVHFTWSDRSSNSAEPEDDFILFPGDAVFARVEAARNNAKNNRVFSLKFTETKKNHFYWMQEPKADNDDEFVRRINIKINGDTAIPQSGAVESEPSAANPAQPAGGSGDSSSAASSSQSAAEGGEASTTEPSGSGERMDVDDGGGSRPSDGPP